MDTAMTPVNRLGPLIDESPARNNGGREVVAAQLVLERQANMEQQLQKLATAVEGIQAQMARQVTSTPPDESDSDDESEPTTVRRVEPERLREQFD